jgi:hypothetical protein
VCPKCSTQTQTAGEYCPHCGASYLRDRRRRKPSRRTARIVVFSVLALALVGGGAAYAIKHSHDQKEATQHRAQLAAARRAADRKRVAQAAAAQAAAAAAAKKRAELQLKKVLRRSLIKSLEDSVTNDAKKDVATGALSGPILRTQCTPVGGGNSDPLAAHTGNWTCMAVTKDDLATGTSEGYAFAATVNYEDSSYTWHLGR